MAQAGKLNNNPFLQNDKGSGIKGPPKASAPTPTPTPTPAANQAVELHPPPTTVPAVHPSHAPPKAAAETHTQSAEVKAGGGKIGSNPFLQGEKEKPAQVSSTPPAATKVGSKLNSPFLQSAEKEEKNCSSSCSYSNSIWIEDFSQVCEQSLSSRQERRRNPTKST
eukprot:TRINITY_DN2092_c0_g1_i1.p1 TRINITY_DN2092_c0_g1~~TRINITY_DN2092_c0_g1_i1.p1  ORF type:complete len:166 (-),score=54.73 TRINITY_DN2092_c0_g1_i1:272-769(-)